MFKFENDELNSENIYRKKQVCHLENYSGRWYLVASVNMVNKGEIFERLVKKNFKDHLKFYDLTVTAMKLFTSLD